MNDTIILNRKCGRCLIEKSIYEFGWRNESKQIKLYICKVCRRKEVLEYRNNNRQEILQRQKQKRLILKELKPKQTNCSRCDSIIISRPPRYTLRKICDSCKIKKRIISQRIRINTLEHKKYQSEWRSKNQHRLKAIMNKYRKSPQGIIKHKEDQKKFRMRHSKEIAIKRRQKYDSNIQVKLQHDLRTIIRKAVKLQSKNHHKCSHTKNLMGCDINFFKLHIESQFLEGMSWSNHTTWHLDHIVPCKYFDLTKPEHQYICFNYRNIRPLWAKDNLAKRDKLPQNYQKIIDNIKSEISKQGETSI